MFEIADTDEMEFYDVDFFDSIETEKAEAVLNESLTQIKKQLFKIDYSQFNKPDNSAYLNLSHVFWGLQTRQERDSNVKCARRMMHNKKEFIELELHFDGNDLSIKANKEKL